MSDQKPPVDRICCTCIHFGRAESEFYCDLSGKRKAELNTCAKWKQGAHQTRVAYLQDIINKKQKREHAKRRFT